MRFIKKCCQYNILALFILLFTVPYAQSDSSEPQPTRENYLEWAEIAEARAIYYHEVANRLYDNQTSSRYDYLDDESVEELSRIQEIINNELSSFTGVCMRQMKHLPNALWRTGKATGMWVLGNTVGRILACAVSFVDDGDEEWYSICLEGMDFDHLMLMANMGDGYPVLKLFSGECARLSSKRSYILSILYKRAAKQFRALADAGGGQIESTD